MIQIDELKYRYSDSAVWALRDTSFSVGNGELIVLTGKSGCGKSTLFRCINGLCPNFFEGEKAGGVFLMGKEISLMRIGDISKMAASVFQNPESQFFTTDVLSDLVFACENYGISKENIQACMDSVVALLSLEPLLGRKLAELSGGEKQKVAIASALMLNADILLMDEPSSNLDYQSIRLLKDTLAGLKAEGYTIMVIEHRLYYLKDICDRLIVLENGEIVRTYEREALTVSDNNAFHEQGLRGVHLFQNAVRGSHAQNAPNPLLALEGIRFGYQKGTDILQGIDLCVYPGDRIALLGKNGCGKTTMGKILCGLKKRAVRLDSPEWGPDSLWPSEQSRQLCHAERGFSTVRVQRIRRSTAGKRKAAGYRTASPRRSFRARPFRAGKATPDYLVHGAETAVGYCSGLSPK